MMLHTAVQTADGTTSLLLPADVSQLQMLGTDQVLKEKRRSPDACSKSPADSVPKHYYFPPE